MVSKKYGENEVRMMFGSFGQIEECRILRGPDGLSRGMCETLHGYCPPSLTTTSSVASHQPTPQSHQLLIQALPPSPLLHPPFSLPPAPLFFKCFSPPLAPTFHSTPIVSSRHSHSHTHLYVLERGPLHLPPGTKGRRLGNPWLLVFRGLS